MALNKLFTSIADAIRNKEGSTEKIVAEDFPNVINNMGESKEITPGKEQQVYEGLYNKVTVEGDSNLVAENIKKDITIFGIQGTHEGTGGGASIPVQDGMLYALECKAGSVAFNGTNTEIDTGVPHSAMANGLTILIRFNPLTWGNYRGLYGVTGQASSGRGGGLCLQYVDGSVYATLIGNNISKDIQINLSRLPEGSWSTLAFSWVNGSAAVYINGELVSKDDTFPTALEPINNLILGKGYSASNRYFKGGISHCFVYDKALSEEEIIEMTNYVEVNYQ